MNFKPKNRTIEVIVWILGRDIGLLQTQRFFFIEYLLQGSPIIWNDSWVVGSLKVDYC